MLEVPCGDELDNRTTKRRLGVARVRPDLRPAHPGKVDGIDRDCMLDLRNHELEVIQLRADRVQKEEVGPADSGLQVPQACSIPECRVPEAPRSGTISSCTRCRARGPCSP